MPNLTNAPVYQRVRPVRDVAFRRRWAADRTWCQICGIPSGAHWLPHTVHHIMRASMRSDEAENMLVACAVCHDRIHSGEIPLGVQLTAKWCRDPSECDFVRLAELHGGSLPPLLPLPGWLVESWKRWQGEERDREYRANALRLAELLGEEV